FQAAYELAHGIDVDIPTRRTPGYPLFLAGTIWSVGEDFQSIALIQHLLGVITAGLTYLLARRLFSPVAGLVAGILVGLSAPLIIFEHYLMSESLFTVFVTAAMLLSVYGLQNRSIQMLAPAGAMVALAYLARPVGGALLPMVAFAAFLLAGSLRQRLLRAAATIAGFALVLAPVLIVAQLTESEGTPALGQTLYGRFVRHDERIVYPSPDSPAPFHEPQRVAARRLVIQAASRDLRPSAVNHRLQESLGLTPREADRALRDFATELISSQTDLYLAGSINKARAILLGEVERLGFHWNSRVDREMRDTWTSNASIAHALTPPSEVQRREQSATEALLRVFQPAQHRSLLGVLMTLGLLAPLLRTQARPAWLIPVATLALVIPAALLVGQVPRYRYPADPMLAVLVGGGVTTLAWLAAAGWSRFVPMRGSQAPDLTPTPAIRSAESR
ncbi:MAG TPA: glycosyltransferase family 39 protein, partial [Chloroflexota bacterium]|nr:glycosyltransferase family 39 protein [Chloroflexota bacterium]